MALRRSWVRIPLGPPDNRIQARAGVVGHPLASRGGCEPGAVSTEHPGVHERLNSPAVPLILLKGQAPSVKAVAGGGFAR